MKKIILYLTYVLIAAVVVSACEEDGDVAVYEQNPENYIEPVLLNDATAPEVVFTAENAAEPYERFTWTKSDYGVSLSVKYIVQVDVDTSFSEPQSLGSVYTDSLAVTNKTFNDAILALGFSDGDQATVSVRVISMLNEYNVATDHDTLTSSSVSRTVTVYQSSECGNYCSIGLIGGATTGSDDTGWSDDIDLRLADQTRTNKYQWTVTVYLYGGLGVKFRAGDAWTNNWGGSGLSGTGVSGGDNISISQSGYYKVDFNDQTLEYEFELLDAPTYTTVGIIGSATTGSEDTGWSTDIDMEQDESDPHIWTSTITLFDGAAKFRANNGWDVNWGYTTFPSGYGTLGGSNIPATAGTYFVRFNDVTGEYAFMPNAMSEVYSDIGIIGSATTGSEDTGWSDDINLVRNPSNPYLWSMTITLFDGGAKFRADNGWDVNWGASGFPGGTGSLGGSNIPVDAGKYFVTFNTGTGEYYFYK